VRIVPKEVTHKGRIVPPVSRRTIDLTAFFDVADADVKADLVDWHGVRRELRKL
jgi:hypothetical protein